MDPETDTALPDWIAQQAAAFEAHALQRLPAEGEGDPARLHAAMRYALLGGGKRIRPLLVQAAGLACQAPAPALAALGLAVECIHTYSLVHDDLPCMDDDVLRRGRPTTHVVYGEALAMLAGDALQAFAFGELACSGLEGAGLARALQELATGAGAAGMCGGQALDLAAAGQGPSLQVQAAAASTVAGDVHAGPAHALERMHGMKTGALLQSSVVLGALAGGASPAALSALARFGAALGLAFQIIDDLLDEEADTAALGKTAGKDRAQGKATYLTVLGAPAARARAQALHAEALAALADSALAGAPTRRLRELCALVIERRS